MFQPSAFSLVFVIFTLCLGVCGRLLAGLVALLALFGGKSFRVDSSLATLLHWLGTFSASSLRPSLSLLYLA